MNKICLLCFLALSIERSSAQSTCSPMADQRMETPDQKHDDRTLLQHNRLEQSHTMAMEKSGDECEPYSSGECKKAATAQGLQLGGSGYSFVANHKTKGCYFYSSGSWKGIAFYGKGGTFDDMQTELTEPKKRVLGVACEMMIDGKTCKPYSQEACNMSATAQGLKLGGAGSGFAVNHGTKGCYSYLSGPYQGITYYGTGGTIDAMKTELTQPQSRLFGAACQTTTTTTTTTTSTTTTTTAVNPADLPWKDTGCKWQCYHDRYPVIKNHCKGDLECASLFYTRHGKNHDCTCRNVSFAACNWECYLARFPGVGKVFGNNAAGAAEHFEQFGYKEGRDCVTCPPICIKVQDYLPAKVYNNNAVCPSDRVITVCYNEGKSLIYGLAGIYGDIGKLKLENPDNFGPSGKVKYTIQTKLVSPITVKNLQKCDIFQMTISQTLAGRRGFVVGPAALNEVAALKNWSTASLNRVLLAPQNIAHAMRKGYVLGTGHFGSATATRFTMGEVIMKAGPFGEVAKWMTWGGFFSSTAYKNPLPANAVSLVKDADRSVKNPLGNHLMVLDKDLGAVFLGDVDIVTPLGKLGPTSSIETLTDMVFGNLYAFLIGMVCNGRPHDYKFTDGDSYSSACIMLPHA